MKIRRYTWAVGGIAATALALATLISSFAVAGAGPSRSNSALSLTPCSYFQAGHGRSIPKPVVTAAPPDQRLLRLLAVFRRPPQAADRTAAARCASLSSGVPLRYVRYVGRGLLGGEIFAVPHPHSTFVEPGIPASSPVGRLLAEPAVCLETVGAPPISGQIGGCTPLSQIRHPAGFGAGEIFPGIGGPQAFARAGVPPDLRHGSLLGGVVRDGITTVDVYDRARRVLTVRARNNAVYFHVNHSAPAAVYMRLVFKDRNGHVVPLRTG